MYFNPFSIIVFDASIPFYYILSGAKLFVKGFEINFKTEFIDKTMVHICMMYNAFRNNN